MNKRPSLQFYPGDWLRDLGLRRCSPTARALWIDMICLMHDGEPYGHLRSGGMDIDASGLSRAAGFTLPEVRRGLAELEAAGVFSRTPDGTIFSRRMLRDNLLRTIRAECGGMGGNPILVNQNQTKPPTKSRRDDEPNSNQAPKQKPTPAVCSLQSAEKQWEEAVVSPSFRLRREGGERARGARPSSPARKNGEGAKALAAWAAACEWVRRYARRPGAPSLSLGAWRPEPPALDPRVREALDSIGAGRLLEALEERPRELGFARREFLAAWEAFEESPRLAQAAAIDAGSGASATSAQGAPTAQSRAKFGEEEKR